MKLFALGSIKLISTSSILHLLSCTTDNNNINGNKATETQTHTQTQTVTKTETPGGTTPQNPIILIKNDELTTREVWHKGRFPAKIGRLIVEGIGVFEFDPLQIKTTRPDIFQLGHFSFFDILVHLHERSEFLLNYHFDEDLNTHVIESVNQTTG